MKDALGSELKRVFANRWFVIALGISLFICLLHVGFSAVYYFDSIGEIAQYHSPSMVYSGYGFTFYTIWYGDTEILLLPQAIFSIVLPVLVCLPFVRSYRLERLRNSQGLTETAAMTPSRWCARLSAIFLSGAAIAIVPLVLDLLVTVFLFPAIALAIVGPAPYGSGGLDTWIKGDNTPGLLLSLVLSFILLAVLAGLLALLGTAVTHRTKKVSIGLVTPFVMYTLFIILGNLVRGPFTTPWEPIKPSILVLKHLIAYFWVHPLLILPLILVVFLAAFLFMYFSKAIRNNKLS